MEGYRGKEALQRRRDLYRNSRPWLWRTGLKISVIMFVIPLVFNGFFGWLIGTEAVAAPKWTPLVIITQTYFLLISPVIWSMIAKTHLKMADKLAMKTSGSNG